MISEVHICLCFSLSSTLAPRKRLHPDKNMLQEYTTLLLTIAINMKPYGKLKQYALLIVCESLTAEDEMVPGMGEYRANQIYKNKIKITSRNTVAKLLSLVFGQLANLSIHSTTGSSVISVHRKNSIHSTTGSLVISVHKKHTLYHWQYCYNYICTQKTHTLHHWQYCYICTQKTSYTPPLAVLIDLYAENISYTPPLPLAVLFYPYTENTSHTASVIPVHRKHIIHSTTGSVVISVHKQKKQDDDDNVLGQLANLNIHPTLASIAKDVSFFFSSPTDLPVTGV